MCFSIRMMHTGTPFLVDLIAQQWGPMLRHAMELKLANYKCAVWPLPWNPACSSDYAKSGERAEHAEPLLYSNVID